MKKKKIIAYRRSIFMILCMTITFSKLAAQIQPTDNLDKKELKQAAKLYQKYRCISCHGKHGNSPSDLTKAAKKYNQQQIKKYIMDPREFGNAIMPVYSDVIPQEHYWRLVAYTQWLGRREEK